MKKLFIATLATMTLAVSACTTTNTTGGVNSGVNTAANVGVNLFKSAVNQKCRTELQANNTWRTIALTMTAEKQAEIENNVCTCVSEKAPQTVTVTELAQAAMDVNARNQLVVTTVGKTLNACYSEFVKP